MSILADLRKLKTGPRDLRKFGLMVGGVFVAIGILMLVRHRLSYPFMVWIGAALIAFGAVWPRGLKYIYLAWMTLAFTLGFVMSNVILVLLFFLLVTPIGLLARLFGKDFLGRKWDKQAESYWIQCPRETRSAESYERQF
ncbi:MAG TPA: SxtJ family membrane protein [Chthoniobacterales bacterium]|nr:SxtJ family membrane protein [Chthoniobacterales bacterium]